MIILNYLLALTLVILSVVKTADLFVQSDKVLEKIEARFVDQTKNLLQKSNKSPNLDQKGSISLTASVLTTLLSLLLLFYITKMKINYQEAVYRKDSYLCFHYLNRQTEKYIKEMAIFNWSLRTAYLIQNSGLASAESIAAIKGLILARNIRHFFYIKNMTRNQYCHIPETVPFLRNIPFKTQTNFTLITNNDETSIIRQKKWNYRYYKQPIGIRLKKSFCLISQFEMNGPFIPKTSYAESESNLEDLSNLKCSSGLSLSPSS